MQEIVLFDNVMLSIKLKSITCSSSSDAFDSCGMGFFGRTRKCVGACGDMSLNATH